MLSPGLNQLTDIPSSFLNTDNQTDTRQHSLVSEYGVRNFVVTVVFAAVNKVV